MKSVCLDQNPCQRDLSDEEQFYAYLLEKPDGYDSDIRYYRWQASANFTGAMSAVSEILKNRHSISPENVLYYESDGKNAASPIEDLGSLLGISELSRGQSGYLDAMTLTCTNGAVRIFTEYNIRLVLGCAVTQITYADGTTSNQVTLLPSSACILRAVSDGTYQITGGGFGHGIGMSQNGANGMAKSGYSYRDILAFFYTDTELVTAAGWQNR